MIENLEERNRWREQYLNVERSKHQLQKDLRVAFDEISELKRDRRNLKNWLKFWAVIGTIEGALLAWFATSLLECLEASHRFAVALR